MLVISLNQILVGFAILELVVALVFIIPLPKGWKPGLLRFVEESPTVKSAMKYHNLIILMVGLHWMYSIKFASDLNEEHRYLRDISHNSVTSKDLYILERKFLAEGDIYLNGTLLFVSIFLNRLISLLRYYYEIKQLNEFDLKVDLSLPLNKILEKKSESPKKGDKKSSTDKKND